MAESSTGSQFTPTPLTTMRTIAQTRDELNARLAAIHNDLQLTQTIGLLFVKREEDLNNAIEGLKTLDGDHSATTDDADLPDAFREQLVALERDFQEGENGVVGLKRLIDAQLPATESSTARPGSSLGPSALPSSSALPAQVISRPRRHRATPSTGPAATDPAFPLQIQDELLNQVRYWQSQAEMKEKLNQDYDTKIQEQERIIEALNKQRRLREEADEKQKEDQWNLELQNQELRNQNDDLQSQLSKLNHENAKLQKASATATELAEQFKAEGEKTASKLEHEKSKFEQELSAMRKHSANQKSELTAKIDELNAAMATQQQKLNKAIQEANQHAQALEEHKEKAKEVVVEPPPILVVAPPKPIPSEEPTTTSTAPVVPAAAPVPEAKATSLARETSFAHQQGIINELQTKLSKEITEKEELKTVKKELENEKEELVKMLADREETIENMRLDPAAFEPHPRAKSRGSLAGLSSELGLHGGVDGMSDDVHDGSDDETNPSGGLFAELAQAASTSTSTAAKSAVESKDQEIMTEPIEDWIRDTPEVEELVNDAVTKAVEAANEKAAAETAVAVATAVEAANEKAAAETAAAVASAVEAANEKAAAETAVAVTKAVDAAAAAATAAAEAKAAEKATIAGKSGTETKPIDVDSSLGDGELVDESQLDKPRRRSRTTVPIDEERRHTCDLSQVIAADHPATEDDEDAENRISYGSAFGNPNAKDTGRIRPIYKDSNTGSAEERAREGDSMSSGEGLSPARAKNGRDAGRHPTTDVKTARPMNNVVSVSSHATYTYDVENTPVHLPHLNSHHYPTITDASGATVGRQHNYRGSPEGSVSSLSTDYNNGVHYRNGRRMSNGSGYETTPTDLTMIQSITQTMIGDYLLKYTRRRMGGNKSHKRYVWVHPYSKTLNWSMTSPGIEGEQRSKSAYIMDIKEETDENPSTHPDQLNVNLVIQTTNRSIKLKAPTREKHDLWYQSIKYLMVRPTTPGADLASDNQTWSEIQDNNSQDGHYRRPNTHNRSLSASSAHLSGEALSMRPIEKPSLRKKTSMARLQSMFGARTPITTKEGSSTSVQSGALPGTTTAAATGSGHENGSTPSNSSSPGLP